MRKRFFLMLFTGFFVGSISPGRAQIKLIQGFETATFPPAGWSLQFTGIQYWERAWVGGYSGSGGSAVFRFYEASGFEIQSLLTPTFTATTVGDSLSFDHAYATYQAEVDSLVIETSTNGGTNYVRLVALAGGANVGTGMVTAPPAFSSFTPASSQWGTKSYSLPPGSNRIRFTAKSAYGNNLYLDNIKVSALRANDVGISGIITPRHFVNMPFPQTPRATITNFGTAHQTSPFVVTMEIRGPSGFFYAVSESDTLSAGLSREVAFSVPFNPFEAGTYTLTCFTSLIADEARSNDTVKTTVVAGNYNYGSNGASGNQMYFFSNSLSGNGAPAQRAFRWKDTTGSTDLIVNGAAVRPLSGDVDDGFFRLTGLFPGRSFRMFGTEYRDSVFVSTNGIVSFTAGYDNFIPSGIPSGTTPNAAIYPMWMDFDFSDSDVPVNRLSYKPDGDILIITYARAPRFNTTAVANEYVTFQVCLRFSESHAANSFFAVQFDASQTGASFLSGYAANNFAHLIGAENNNGTSAVTYRFVSGGAPVTAGPAFGSSLAVTFGPAYESTVSLNARAYLEGPYSTTTHAMRTDIRSLIPLSQPYSAAPWSFAGAETIGAAPAGMVDWVLLELRTSTAATSGVAERSALLLSDGSIVDLDGTSPVLFDLIAGGSYYVVVSHRNHLPIMTGAAVPLSGTPLSYNFSTGQGQAFGAQPMNQLEAGRFGMVGGDANASGIVSTADANAVFGSLGAASYSSRDVNMSGIVSTADANAVFVNLDRTTGVPLSAPRLAAQEPSPLTKPVSTETSDEK